MRTLVLLLLLTAGAFAYEGVAVNFPEPAGWEAHHDQKTGKVRFLASQRPGPRPVLEFSSVEMESDVELTRARVLTIVGQLSEHQTQFELLGQKAIRVAGNSGHLISYSARSGETRLVTSQAFFLRNGRLHAFTLVTAPSDHEDLRPAFDAVLQGLEWKM